MSTSIPSPVHSQGDRELLIFRDALPEGVSELIEVREEAATTFF